MGEPSGSTIVPLTVRPGSTWRNEGQLLRPRRGIDLGEDVLIARHAVVRVGCEGAGLLLEALDGLGADAVEVALLGRPGGDQAAARQGRDREEAVVIRDDDLRFLAPPLEVRVLVQVGVVPEGQILEGATERPPGGLVGQAPAHQHAALQGDVEGERSGPGLAPGADETTIHIRLAVWRLGEELEPARRAGRRPGTGPVCRWSPRCRASRSGCWGYSAFR